MRGPYGGLRALVAEGGVGRTDPALGGAALILRKYLAEFTDGWLAFD
jgi:hypothetical protein